MELSWETQLERTAEPPPRRRSFAVTVPLARRHLSSWRRVKTKNFTSWIDVFLCGKNKTTFSPTALLTVSRPDVKVPDSP